MRRQPQVHVYLSRKPNVVEFRNRQSLSLTQVSNRLREEFLPIYLSSSRLTIDSRESAAYIAAFYPQWVPPGGFISDDLEEVAYKTYDFLPILRLGSVGFQLKWH